MSNIELIEQLIETAELLPHRNSTQLDAVRRRSEMIIRKVFGDDSKYLTDLNAIKFFPMMYPADEQYHNNRWNSGKAELLNLFRTMAEELTIFGAPSSPSFTEDTTPLEAEDNHSRQIFVVHGHDEVMKQTVARILEKLRFDPVILHERENSGRTIIEKFTDLSDVPFAVVLLSPDDLVASKDESVEPRYRARQNVIFELGYFIGRLGRKRVVALYREDANFEMPSDYSGVLFIPYDERGRWQFLVAKELSAVGFEIDANVLL